MLLTVLDTTFVKNLLLKKRLYVKFVRYSMKKIVSSPHVKLLTYK